MKRSRNSDPLWLTLLGLLLILLCLFYYPI